ncbi:cation:proton antiporter domain-containing protein [Varunaivibrio sulfuroxidans]|uniref:cation:proton antiporter domain-containing protein n=1 Tax=Varunaivibrio sulfuroxidans TaxID=1773489 RepID=UPI0010442D3E|nr:cation:proton antiporter [Varunaivibrio sulfuroxidans]WES30308.1 cation:proton antiporter [Varunaivibrio sulfuroxidans]
METAAHTDLTGVALVVVAALLCGVGMERLRQPALIGYMLAGVILGPSGLALVEDRARVDALAELGVLLLLFVVGLELSLRVFRRIWKITVVATLGQIVASVAITVGLSYVLNWPWRQGVLIGFVVAMSSTAVAIKVLEEIGELRSRAGRITVGVLIAQDLAVVPMMLIVSVMGTNVFDWLAVVRLAGSVGLLGGLVWYLGRGRKVRIPYLDRIAKNDELPPLTALAFCFSGAAASGVLGLSPAYGAFIAGLVLGNSTQRRVFETNIMPIQNVLMMVFFLSIGLLIDLGFIWNHLGTVLLLLFVVAIFKTVLNAGLLRMLGQDWPQAFLAAVMLAQIGEFSFLLAMLGLNNGVIDPEGARLVIAVTVLSLALSPLWVVTARRLHNVASEGVSSAKEVLTLIYGREVDIVGVGVGGVRVYLVRLSRVIMRKRGERRAPAADDSADADAHHSPLEK